MSKHRWWGASAFAASLLLAVAAFAGGGSTPASQGRTGIRAFSEARSGEGGVLATIRDHLNGFSSWYYGQRAAPAKHIPFGARMAALAQANQLRAQTKGIHTASVSSPWTTLGPAPINADDPLYADPYWGNYGSGFGSVSGRVTALAVDPTNANVVYMGAADGGVWKTTNGGASWSAIADSVLGTQSIGAIAIPSAAHNTVFVGSGEANTSSDSYYGDGIYKSTNGGASFTHLGGVTFNRLTIFKIVTGALGGRVYAATDRGLYRSLDGGSSWSLVLAPGDPALFQSFVTDVVVMPGTSGHQVLAVVGWRGGKTTNGLYLSHDSGTTFKKLSPSGFPGYPYQGRVALAVTGSQPGLVYAIVQDAVCFNTGSCPANGNGALGTVLNGVYKSTNTGSSWTEVATPAYLAAQPSSALTPDHIGCTCYNPGVQAWYNLHIEIDPTNPNDVIFGLEEVWNSSNGGTTWSVIGRYWDYCVVSDQPWCGSHYPVYPTTHPDQHAAAFGLVSGNPKLYIGSDGGVWSQVGPGFTNDSWSDLNNTTGPSTIQCYFADEAADGTVACGSQDNGLEKYTGGSTWPEIAGGDGGDVAIDSGNSNNIIGEYVDLIMYRTNDGGASFTTIAPPDPDARFIAPFDVDPSNPNNIYALGQKLWLSYAGFHTKTADWHTLYNLGFPRQGTALSVNDGNVYVGWCGPCNPSNFSSSSPFNRGIVTNVGGTMHAVAATDLPNRYITAITQDPNNSSHIYVTQSGYSRRWIPNAGIGHVFESTDGGANFTDISSNLPDTPANDLLLVGSNVLVATDVGVFIQDGSNWDALGTGMPAVSTLDLSVQPGTQKVYAATHGRGVYVINLA